jgi:hypothetical protein
MEISPGTGSIVAARAVSGPGSGVLEAPQLVFLSPTLLYLNVSTKTTYIFVLLRMG